MIRKTLWLGFCLCMTANVEAAIVAHTTSASGGLTNLDSVTVTNRGVVNAADFVDIDVFHWHAASSTNTVLSVLAADPGTGSRATLIDGDLALNTGMINPGDSLTLSVAQQATLGPANSTINGLGVNFVGGVTNGPGVDLIVFKNSAGLDGFRINRVDGTVGDRVVPTSAYTVSGSALTTRLISPDSTSLNNFESSATWTSAGTPASTYVGVGVDLTNLGYSVGQTAPGLFFSDAPGDGNADFVLIRGLPSVSLPPTTILDDVPGADAAYSLRKLDSGYTGDAIRVRRSSDGTELDIGFTAEGYLDVGALLTFVGTGDGFVTTWYDQSGNGFDVADTDVAQQPQVVDSGSVILASNGLPAVEFDGTDDTLSGATTGLLEQNDIFAVAEYDSAPTADNLLDMRLWNLANGGSTRFSAGGNDGVHAVATNSPFTVHESTQGVLPNQPILVTTVSDATGAGATDSVEVFLNGPSIFSNSAVDIDDNDNTLVLGAQEGSGLRSLDGFLQEVIFYGGTSNLSLTDRQSVSSGLIAAYGIVPEPGTGLLVMLGGIAAVGLRRRKR